MPTLVRKAAAAIVLGVSLLPACTDRLCEDYLRYDLNDAFAVNASGYDAFACEITFSAGDRSARYELPALRAPSAGEVAPPAPTMSDDDACGRGFPDEKSGCAVHTGPTASCERTLNCLRAVVYDQAAEDMRTLLGGSRYDAAVSCGGVLIYEILGREAERRLCPN